MEFKGTKGNWWACCLGKGNKSHYVFGHDGQGGAVCAMLSNDPIIDKEHYEHLEETITNKERQANAQLIATAPELLESLQELYSSVNNATSMHLLNDPMQKAKQAIEKALK